MLISAVIAANLLLLLALAAVGLACHHRGYRRGQADRPDYKRVKAEGYRLGIAEGEPWRDSLQASRERLQAENRRLLDDLAHARAYHRTGNVRVIPSGDLGFDRVRSQVIPHDGTEGAR